MFSLRHGGTSSPSGSTVRMVPSAGSGTSCSRSLGKLSASRIGLDAEEVRERFFSDTGRISTVTGKRSLGGTRISGEVSELAVSANSSGSVDVNACVHSSASGPKPKERLVTGGETGTEGIPSRRGEVGVKRDVWAGGGV